jgi:hypothetical protein
MADIFRKTNKDREDRAGLGDTPPPPAAVPAPEKPAIDFFKPRAPVDPEKSAALKAAKIRQLRDGV